VGRRKDDVRDWARAGDSGGAQPRLGSLSLSLFSRPAPLLSDLVIASRTRCLKNTLVQPDCVTDSLEAPEQHRVPSRQICACPEPFERRQPCIGTTHIRQASMVRHGEVDLLPERDHLEADPQEVVVADEAVRTEGTDTTARRSQPLTVKYMARRAPTTADMGISPLQNTAVRPMATAPPLLIMLPLLLLPLLLQTHMGLLHLRQTATNNLIEAMKVRLS
jgi:hypothetical protein